MTTAELSQTPLFELHEELGARMTAFAGYEMPLRYRDGGIAEHRWTRERAGLFDVSHMGQMRLRGPRAAEALERLVTADVQGLAPNAQVYALLLNDEGGIKDDLMIARPDADGFFLVVNAAEAASDITHLHAHLGEGAELEVVTDRALLALQGPEAVDVLAELAPDVADMAFMSSLVLEIAGEECVVSRSGYTGEDGFEISVPAARADTIARMLLESDHVRPIGLGARDSLRLEAGLCLYGHDIDATTSPVEAGLLWTLPKARRERGDFPGAARIQREIADGASRKRVGIRFNDKAPAREGARIITADGGEGVVTSGLFSPTLEAPIAMGYAPPASAKPGTALEVEVRGRRLAAEVVKTPFVAHRYVGR